MNEHGDRLPVALDPRDRSLGARGRELEGVSGNVDVGRALGKPVADLERRIAERTRERVAKRPRPRLAELDDEVGHLCPLPGPAEETGEEADRQGHERRFVRQERGVLRFRGRHGEPHDRVPRQDGSEEGGRRNAARRSRRSRPAARR